MIPHKSSYLSRSGPSTGSGSQPDGSAAVTKLKDAVAHFQAMLTDDDRMRLQGLKKLPHDAQSIIAFTAELDKQKDGNRRGKSIASRLTSFLQIVQQFTPIIDTYIQSNPDITALIWGSIKLTFMVYTLVATGRLGHYQILFQDSTRLNDSVCEFHTSVILCCEKVVRLIRQSTLASQVWRAVTSSFQTEIRSYVEKVKEKAEDAQSEIELAKAQADHHEQEQQAKERREASDYRQQLSMWATKYSAAMKDMQHLKNKHAKDKKRSKLVYELTSYNSMTTFNSMRNKRHMGTAEWCFSTTEYQEWFNANKAAVLHITGKIGSGKTILASSIIEQLCYSPRPRQFTSFFFLRFDEGKSLSISTVIRSCLQQLLASSLIEGLDTAAMSELDDSLNQAASSLFSDESLRLPFITAAKHLDDWFIIIDGLDEIGGGRYVGILEFLREVFDQLPEAHRIKLLLSSRETCSNHINSILPQTTCLRTGLGPTSSDIKLYAEDLIRSKIATNDLIVSGADLVEEIITVIHRKEGGMFLWAFLTIEDICSRKSDKDIRQALEDIPADLPAAFDRTLGRIMAMKNNTAIVRKTFALVQASFEPLTLGQLREALSIEIGQHTLDNDDLISGIDRLPTWCQNLVCVEDSGTVHFSHHSIQQYLLSPDSGDFKDFHLNADQCDSFMGELCITYISLDNFQRAVVPAKSSADPLHMDIHIGGVAEQTMRTAVGGSLGSFIGRLTREAVLSSQSQKYSSGKVQWNDATLSSISRRNFDSPQRTEGHSFFQYASEHWYRHRLSINSDDNVATWRLLGRILQKPRQYSQGEPWFQSAWINRVSKITDNFVDFFDLEFSSYRIVSVPQGVAEHGQLKNNSTVRDLCHVFIYAIRTGNGGLACRVLMMIVEDFHRSPEFRCVYLEYIIRVMAMSTHHNICQNQCLRREELPLNHRILVEEVRQAIAGGISDLPPALGAGGHNGCKCHKEYGYSLRQDVCQLLETGYQRHEQPYMVPFAILAQSLVFHHSIETLSTFKTDKGIELELLVTSKTLLGRSFVDLLFEWAVTRHQPMKIFISDRSPSTERVPYWIESMFVLEASKVQLLNTLRLLVTAQEVDADGIEEVEKALTECLETGGSVPLHETTIELLFDHILVRYYWPKSMCDGMVKVFFGQSMKPGLLGANERVLSHAVRKNNWDLAISLIDIQPISEAEWGFVGDISYIKYALRCHTCRTTARPLLSAPTEIGPSNYLPTSFGLCSVHRDLLRRNIDGQMLDNESRALFSARWADRLW
ncbi:heterokaryon incompatibility protein het-E-1 [Fusarium coicis]|nr:heterokaryon incompatibility protein het-E-1 [Fusarium coicis]